MMSIADVLNFVGITRHKDTLVVVSLIVIVLIAANAAVFLFKRLSNRLGQLQVLIRLLIILSLKSRLLERHEIHHL